MNDRASSGTQSVQRAIQLLKMFDDNHAEWNLNDLCAATELNKTTVFRILSALEAEGLLQKTVNSTYRLGPESIAIGGRAMRANNLRMVSRAAMDQLARETKETATLEILRPDMNGFWSMLVIDEVVSQHLIGITQYIGSRLPVHATSTGKAVLAFQSDDFLAEVIQQPRDFLTDETILTDDAFYEELQQIKAQGYALAAGELERGVMAAASPIFNHDGTVLAALCITGPSIRINDEKLVQFAKMVKATADDLSYQMGYRPT